MARSPSAIPRGRGSSMVMIAVTCTSHEKSGPGFPRPDHIRRAVYIRWASCQMCQRPVDCRLRLDFSGAAADFRLAGFPPIVDDKRPAPANVDIDGPNNLVGNAPISHRKAFQKWGGPRNT